MATVTVHGFAGSTATRAVLLLLAEKGVDWALVPARLREPTWRGLHPFGKMPVLDHGEVRLFEVAAILRYVDEVFPAPSFTPAAPADRARMTQWSSAVGDYLQQDAVRGVLIPRFVLAPNGIPVDEERITRSVAACRVHLAAFERALAASPYLAGEAPTLADFHLLPIVAGASRLGEAERFTDGLPALAGWYARMSARPSWAATA